MSSPAAQLREPELAAYFQQLSAIDADVAELIAGLSTQQLAWRPTPQRWSIVECLEHLQLTIEQYTPNFERALARGRAEGIKGTGPFIHPGRLRNWINRTIEPPYKFKAKTGGGFVPRSQQDPATVLANYVASHHRLRDWLRRADGLDLASLRVPHPIFGRLLHWTLGQAFAQVLGHERRHVWQAWQVRQSQRL